MNLVLEYTLKPAVRNSLIIIGALIILFVVLFFFIRKIDPMKKTPLWLVPFMWIVDLINNFVKENIGIRWKKFAPWFLTVTIYIFFSNISAVFLLDNPTGYIMICFALGFTSFCVIQIAGIVSNGPLGYLKGFIEPIPLMLPMNLVSEVSLPISLSLRLFGNVTSGACISLLIKGAFGWGSVAIMPFINIIFDIGFSLIQVAVFVILTIIFTSMKIKDEEKIYGN